MQKQKSGLEKTARSFQNGLKSLEVLNQQLKKDNEAMKRELEE